LGREGEERKNSIYAGSQRASGCEKVKVIQGTGKYGGLKKKNHGGTKDQKKSL